MSVLDLHEPINMKLCLFISSLIAFQSFAQTEKITIEFKSNVFESNKDFEIETLRFYISSIQIDFDGDSSYYEPNSYHLVDLSDSTSVSFELEADQTKSISSLKFNIGTDSLINVSGALDGDLDPILGMYWAWNTGYINFKLEGKQSNSYKQHNFEYHIGGYSSPYSTCREVELEVKSREILIEVDVLEFLSLASTISSSIIMPGKEAKLCADIYQKIFVVDE